jgi:hypothetical protein
MKRVALGFAWFVGLYMGSLMIGGAVAGFRAAQEINQRNVANVSDGFNKGHAAGEAAGRKFGEEYGGPIFLASLIVAVVGTATGFLPGTEKKRTT